MKTEFSKQKSTNSTGLLEKDSLLGKRAINQDHIDSIEDKSKQ